MFIVRRLTKIIFRSTETEDKKDDKNGLGHLGQMSKNARRDKNVDIALSTLLASFCVDLKFTLSIIQFVKHYTHVKLERANLRSTQKSV